MKKNRKELETDINVRAWKDPKFRKKLHDHPREALMEMGLKNIPSGMNIKIVEEDGNHWCIVLHKAPTNAHQMSEADLKKTLAAGGEPQMLCG